MATNNIDWEERNPYSATNEAKRKAKRDWNRTAATMMKASATSAAAAKKKKKQSPATSADPTKSIAARAAATKRNEDRRAKQVKGDFGKKGNWQSHTWDFFGRVLDKLKACVFLNERGAHKLEGEWPAFAYGHIQPSKDPVNFFRNGVIQNKEPHELTREDFALPDIFIWDPELSMPQCYPCGKPECPFHPGDVSCVIHNGYNDYVRRCFGPRGNIGLIGRRYLCKRRQEESIEPYTFYSYDPGVVNSSPDYVKGFWRENGFKMSKRGAISWTVIDQMRSLLANGAGASGYLKSLREAYKQRHSNVWKMWRSHCDTHHQVGRGGERIEARTMFFASDDPRAELHTPSLNFLLSSVIEEIELKIPFYTRKLQMQGGRFLSADHSHKYAKVVLIQGERGFEGLYTVMNEYGKILGFWFVNGTTLNEVEGVLRGINSRYQIHGFAGPFVFTTDRCCDERSFISGDKNKNKCPVFDAFQKYNDTSAATADASPNNDCNDDMTAVQFSEVRELDLPCKPIIPSTIESAQVAINGIIQQYTGATISIDSEWIIGEENGPDVFTICLPGNQVILLQRHVYPPSLKVLMESPDIKKVANRIINAEAKKLREIGIELQGAIELGHVAKERGIVDRKNPSLEELVTKLFDCDIDKDQTLRCSAWGNHTLSREQVRYACIDAYAHWICFQKLKAMPYVDPVAVSAPTVSDLKPGDPVLLYTRNKHSVVASGVYVQQKSVETPFGTTTSKSVAVIRVHDVSRPGAIVHETPGNWSIGQLKADAEGDEELVEIPWKVADLRRCDAETTRTRPEDVLALVKTTMVPIPASNTNNEGNSESSPDIVPSPDATDDTVDPDHEKYFHKGVKQDIEHIFLRFAKKLSKKHGAFGAFMSRLSDAFFAPSQMDIDFIKAALRKAGLSDAQIKSKKWSYFKRRVRRSVPGPKELEQEFNRVVNLFADVIDAKSKLPLFGKDAWNLYKSTLKHIRKGCLSDLPDMAYYVQTGEDSLGIPLFTCLRGTSALEGFHQKIRQVIRGFNVSPRYALALLHEFVYRWNHDIDIRILGMPMEYACYYDGWEIEEEIEIAATWSELLDIVHSPWECTKDFVSTGEEFGLIRHSLGATTAVGLQDGDELESEMARVIDEVLDCDDDTGNDTERIVSSQVLTASAAWVGKQLGQKRAVRRIQSETEKLFFQSHYLQFLLRSDEREANNFSSFAWSRFALFWNEWIQEEEQDRRPKSDMTLKSAFHLQAYYKTFKQEGNAAATLLPIHAENKKLRRELRGSTRESDVSFQAAAPCVEDVPLQPSNESVDADTNFEANTDDDVGMGEDNEGGAELQPIAIDEVHNLHEQATSPSPTNRVVVQTFAGALPTGFTAETYLQKKRKQVAAYPSRKSRCRKRCRMCGHPYAKGEDMHKYHLELPFNGMAHTVCTTPEDLRASGFPCLGNARMPRIHKLG